MSARLFKKAVKEQEEQNQQRHQLEDEEEEERSPDSSVPSLKNPFDLLNDGDSDDDDADHQDQHLEKESEIPDKSFQRKFNNPALSFPKGTAVLVTTSDQKSKKKKKKRSKEVSSSSADKVDKSLDETLETFSLDSNSPRHQHSPSKGMLENAKVGCNVKQSALSILQVDPKYLNAEYELRRIFGSKVVKSFEKSNQASSSRQLCGGRRGSLHTRKTMLVSLSEHWARWDGSFSMEFLETRDGLHYFRYAQSSSYDQAQSAFEAAKAIHDLNGIASILLYHPYHLDSLITMAEYFKFVGEQQMSADAIAKCLYALECAWHPMFSPLQGNCQLKFSEETNKPLFHAIFTHMKDLDRRGCHRSALEVCKLLLSLDSDDLMGAKFCIDYFALRAEEFAWLERFCEDYKSDNSLWLFPNFSYSLAICRLHLEREESAKDSLVDTTKATSTDLMKQALMLHPSVLKKLVDKVPLKDQAWTNILKTSFFRSHQAKIPSLDHLINIYVERSYLIWRLPDVQKLVRDAALTVIGTLEHTKEDAKDWACVRKEAFSSEKNEYAHLSVPDFSDSVPTLPPDNLQNFMIDPRMMEAVQNGGQIANPLADGHVPAPRNVVNRNPLAVLLESMLPWVNYGSGGDGRADEDNQPDGHGQAMD
ncbi:Tcf25 domain-containing protein [Cephalotus follicularis]|uniref:Tcf25 domain-containing protein n=1 Tax=Cephalotus follicularis TaxID=3775 RepID=A0A1Q3BTV2_CEPFO|nr:Tcf25 domain-containing protein [Cephalotus follicularis]